MTGQGLRVSRAVNCTEANTWETKNKLVHKVYYVDFSNFCFSGREERKHI